MVRSRFGEVCSCYCLPAPPDPASVIHYYALHTILFLFICWGSKGHWMRKHDATWILLRVLPPSSFCMALSYVHPQQVVVVTVGFRDDDWLVQGLGRVQRVTLLRRPAQRLHSWLKRTTCPRTMNIPPKHDLIHPPAEGDGGNQADQHWQPQRHKCHNRNQQQILTRSVRA